MVGVVVLLVLVLVGGHFIYNFVSYYPILVKFVLNERANDLVYILWAEFRNLNYFYENFDFLNLLRKNTPCGSFSLTTLAILNGFLCSLFYMKEQTMHYILSEQKFEFQIIFFPEFDF